MGVHSIFLRIFKIIFILVKEITKIIFASVLLVSIPILLLILSPVFIIRRSVYYFSRYFRPDLDKMVTTLGSIIVQDELYTSPTLNVVVGLTFEGKVSISTVKNYFEKNATQRYLSNRELKYPELQQYPVPWCGFMFWKTDTNFNIENHFVEHNADDSVEEKNYTEKDIQMLSKNLVDQPWMKNRPLWKVTLVHDYFPNGLKNISHSILLVTVHHTLGDGYSILSMLINALANQQIEIPQPTHRVIQESSNNCKNFLKAAFFPFKSAYEFAEHTTKLMSTMSWRSYWNSKGGVKGEKMTLTLSERILIKDIKKIKSEQQVTFSSVILSIIAGAIRETMIKKGEKIPKSVSCFTYSVPPRETLKLRNLASGSALHLPIGQSDDIKRLQLCGKEYERLKGSSIPILTAYILIPMVGGLFNSWVKVIGKSNIVPIGFSNFPAGKNFPTLEGSKCVDVFFTSGTALNNYGLVFCVISYEDALRISTISTDRLMTTNDLDAFNDDLQKQIRNLQNHLVV